MADREQLEKLFLENLRHIDRVIALLARRHGLVRDDADDFASWARLRLIENEYAILAKFRGESSLPTYLTVVLASLMRDYRAARWGRWRPSAAAVRHGPVAVRLELLVYRQNMPFAQAAEVLRSSGETSASNRHLASVLELLPRRQPLRATETTLVDDTTAEASDDAERGVAEQESEAERASLENELARILAELPDEDRVVVRLRYWEGLSVADTARALGIPQKPLYRRLERLITLVRSRLERAGVTKDRVISLIEEDK
jgi:RNA polymerase sigma factor (sigma-70 family)